jgi:gliding motility-associated protein GldM
MKATNKTTSHTQKPKKIMANDAKTSPRQRMVGMMYLVLTAMLAMQVKNTVLDKFIDLDDSIRTSVGEARYDNQRKLEGIREAAAKRGSRPADLAVVQEASQTMEATSALLRQIEQMREALVERTGGLDEEGNYLRADNEDEVMALALGAGDSKDGMAYALEEALNRYAAQIGAIDTALKVPKLALPASEIPRYRGQDGQEGKDFAELNFAHTPLVAALAVLSEMQARVVGVETQALQTLAGRVGARDLVFDRVVPVVSPESRYVVAGMPYRAQIYTAAYSSAATPDIRSSRGAVAVRDGVGYLEFVAGASQYDDKGQAKASWNGEIRLSTPTGDTLLRLQEEYVVVRPNLKFESATVQALYRNCGNTLQVQVPELGANYQPEFSAGGEASVIPGNRTGMVTVVPKGNKVELTVKNRGAVLGTQSFRVKPIPKPSLALYANGRKLNLRQPGELPRSIQVQAIADEDFAAQLPQDARYRVTAFDVVLAKGSREVLKRSFTGPTADLTEFAQKANGEGYRLVVEVKKVERMNFRNERETVQPTDDLFIYTVGSR